MSISSDPVDGQLHVPTLLGSYWVVCWHWEPSIHSAGHPPDSSAIFAFTWIFPKVKLNPGCENWLTACAEPVPVASAPGHAHSRLAPAYARDTSAPPR